MSMTNFTEIYTSTGAIVLAIAVIAFIGTAVVHKLNH